MALYSERRIGVPTLDRLKGFCMYSCFADIACITAIKVFITQPRGNMPSAIESY